jgi:fluoride exporter
MWKSILVLAIGSVVGGLLRWSFSIKLNALFPTIPLGTLLSNLVAGYVIGFAIACFAQIPGLAPEWRLLIMTGFCGGLSTFSTFSAEVVTLIQRGQLAWAADEIGIHVAGSLVMTMAGIVRDGVLHIRKDIRYEPLEHDTPRQLVGIVHHVVIQLVVATDVVEVSHHDSP